MKTFQLSNQITSKSGIVKYSYKSDDMIVIFHFHPTKAWNFVCDYASSNMTQKIYNNILNSFVNKGISQHEYVGGFNEAIKVLSF